MAINNQTGDEITSLLDENIGHPTPGFDPNNCWSCAIKAGLDPVLQGIPRAIYTNGNYSHAVLKVLKMELRE